jgi:hypothetical protein
VARPRLPPPCRQRLIGREVSVSMEYNRKVAPAVGEGAARPAEERTMAFGTVTVAEGAGADQKVSTGGAWGWVVGAARPRGGGGAPRQGGDCTGPPQHGARCIWSATQHSVFSA